MNKISKKILTLFFFTIIINSCSNDFIGFKEKIKPELKAKMLNVSYKENCPIDIDSLAYLTLSYIDFSGEKKIGHLITHQDIATQTINVFRLLYKEGYPINSMNLIIDYEGSDDASMAANNSSAFNCRAAAGTDKIFSKHSYGVAIDLNPMQNPYVKNQLILPSAGKKYLDRNIKHPALIRKGDKIYNAFIANGFIWGGEWRSLKDYHHFEYPLSQLNKW